MFATDARAMPVAAGLVRQVWPELPPGAAGHWIRLRVGARADAPWWVKLELADAARGQVVREAFLGPSWRRGGRRWRETLLHVPGEAGTFELQFYGAAVRDIVTGMAVLSRAGAAWRLLRSGAFALPSALAGDARGRIGRVRAVLGQGPARRGEAPPYAEWIRLFERIGAPVTAPPPVLVIGGDWRERERSLAGIAAQGGQARLVNAAEDWPARAGEWVVLLRAGEGLADGALARFSAMAEAEADFVYADLDLIDAGGARHTPFFKPGPGPAGLHSGLLTRGACLVRWPGSAAGLPREVEAAKLALALRAGGRVARIEAVLTHLPENAAGAVRPAADARARPPSPPVRVSVVVASACRSAHVRRCLERVIATTRTADIEILLAVSAIDPADRRQARRLRELAALPRVRVLALNSAPFNYPAVNNAAAREAQGELLLLLNDDVSPIRAGWLEAMARHFQEPDVGAVGARLLYGNGRVQHGGVILGLANLCEHAGRLRRPEDAAPFGLALVDREVSAVTAACMMVRAAAFRDLGGLDPGFAVALNDVDFCLRLREAGWRIVQCAGAELHHYESLSLGRHYRGERAVLEAVEVRRLRARWAAAIAADPFYNRQASLEPGREWLPAFPPRGPGFSATLAKASALA